MRPAHLRSAAELGADKPHGTRIKYMSGCKCMLCRAANSRYETARAELRRQGLDNGFISAKLARAHITCLSKKGIGRRTISRASGVPQSSIFKIKKGVKKQIRKNTHRRIMAVSAADAAGKTLISAAATWRMINKLLDEGFMSWLNWLFPGKSKAHDTGTFSAGPDEVIIYNAAEYANVIHEGFGSSEKFGPRRFLTDAFEMFNRGLGVIMAIRDEIQKVKVKAGLK